LQA
jgi:hypothetical protein